MVSVNSVRAFKPKSFQWDSMQMLQGITRDDLTINETEILELEELFWNDICSEYDADNFCQFLKKSGIRLSSEFKIFEAIWQRDEWNHYLGFRQIYSLLYQKSCEEIDELVAAREVDFSPILEFLEDEFMICLVLAYDEIATTRSYRMDFELYKSFGPQPLADWIKCVARDEAVHFSNILNIIRLCHSEHIPKVPKFVKKLVDYDLANHDYKGTFVLDHKGYYFTPDFLYKCSQTIARAIFYPYYQQA